MSGEHEHELRAVTEDLEVVIRFDDFESVSPSLKEALAELADALVAEQTATAGEDEVQGFGLEIGSMGLSARGVSTGDSESCWGFTFGGHCYWYSGRKTDEPGTRTTSCTIHSVRFSAGG